MGWYGGAGINGMREGWPWRGEWDEVDETGLMRYGEGGGVGQTRTALGRGGGRCSAINPMWQTVTRSE